MATINPLQAPINYMGMIPQVNLGQEFAEFGQALAQRQERIKKQEFQKQYSQDLQSAIATPTQKTWNDMIAKYPQQREAFESARKGYGEERLTNEFNQGFAVSAALENNKPEIAKAELQKTIEARKNSGQQTQIYQQAFDALEAGNVTGAQAIVNMALSTADPERFKKTVESQTTAKQAPSLVSESAAKAEEAVAAATIAKANATNAAENAKADAQLKAANAAKAKVESEFAVRQEQGKLDLNKANIANLNNQISDRAAQRNIDRQRLALDTTAKMVEIQSKGMEIPEHAQKLVNETAINAAAAKQSANQFNNLSNELSTLPNSWGALNSLGEWSKKQFGNQDFRSAIQGEYTRLANSAGIKAYKASGASGSMSDADLAVALAGIPPGNSNPKEMARFMRGMAKMQEIDASVNNAKVDWLSSNSGQLGRAKRDFIAGDYQVKAGETYADFANRVGNEVTKRYANVNKTPEQLTEEQRLRSVAQIPTTSGAPAAARPVSNIRSQADAILSGGR